MQEEILISVILPVYKVEKYINRCLDSICRQTYNNLEVILVDDGSPDNSGKICDQYASRYNNFIAIHKKNGGVSSARKEGLARAHGKYISFVDSDDYLEDDYFEMLAEKIFEDAPDIVCCNCIDEGDTHQPNICILEDIYVEKISDKMKCYFAGMRFAYVIWGKLYKKELIDKIYMPPMRYTEDTYMMLQAFQLSTKIVLLNYAGYHYRVQEESAMAVAKKIEVIRDTLITIEFVREICSNLNSEYKEKADALMQKYLYIAILENCRVTDRTTRLIDIKPYVNKRLDSKKVSLQSIKEKILIILYFVNEKMVRSILSRFLKDKI